MSASLHTSPPSPSPRISMARRGRLLHVWHAADEEGGKLNLLQLLVRPCCRLHTYHPSVSCTTPSIFISHREHSGKKVQAEKGFMAHRLRPSSISCIECIAAQDEFLPLRSVRWGAFPYSQVPNLRIRPQGPRSRCIVCSTGTGSFCPPEKK